MILLVPPGGPTRTPTNPPRREFSPTSQGGQICMPWSARGSSSNSPGGRRSPP
ncbi:hypothetical protein [Methanoculleus chikugoensis]|uniref:hypothetical protein n=1 Tax=Methanoculleus chikugoensis TaxID=118126 RepID=UPI001FB45EEB|nr:hypothetical protein [Methanoculleus chikugoensis]